MISVEDAYYTYEYQDHYKILPSIHDWSEDPARIGNGKKCAEGFCYSSDNNSQWMSPEELNGWMAKEYGSSKP
jgi:UDP-N-acetylglucosamine 4,6-dehydratase